MSTVVAIFKDLDNVNRGVEALNNQGISNSQISVMARENTFEALAHEKELKQEASEGVMTGAVGGASFGLFAGLIAGVGSLMIPGIGPVIAGSTLVTLLGTTAAGAGIGAVAGGAILGSLVKMGISQEDANLYAEGVKRGGILVTVDVPPEQVSLVTQTLNAAGAESTEALRSKWQGEGWQHFDSTTEPTAAYPTLTIM
ncbi:MAG: general stress protein [Anaerolineae bacterium]|nr:general stress protein [Anaerolineae bacterium]